MEGEGASIVSHAAAETRGMNSADEEPELPSAVQDLIRRLEGKGEPITRLPYLGGEEFQDFFPEIASPSTITGWRSQVRLRVLEAIGSCKTLEVLDVEDICGGEISMMTVSEWELVLRGFMSSTVLQEITLRGLEWISDEEVESLCLQIGRILNTSSVTQLTIIRCRILSPRLSARCFLNLASGLRGNSDSKLQSLELRDAWEDSSAVKHVADMINSATGLERLSLGYIDYMDKETVGILSQALIQSSSLKELILKKLEWGAALLLNALAGDDSNRSIERLRLKRMNRLGDCLRELLTSNPSLMEVRLDDLRMSLEEWHQLGEVIRDNSRVTEIEIKVKCGYKQWNWESIEALACAASSDVKDPTVELQLMTSNDHEVKLVLSLLGRVLRGEINSLKSFSILARYPRNSGINQDRPESVLAMNGKTAEPSVLKRLKIMAGNHDFWKGVWKDLLWCLRGNTSLTHLDLSGSDLDKESFRDLMGLLQVNLALREIDVSATSLDTEGNAALIHCSFEKNLVSTTSLLWHTGGGNSNSP
ncbi:hypothetical protein AXG93_473s1070 [Marchantia polymorpha subsp. ruderalis]|uniref:Uncharacterized protein n=1 Tax=Marchantia polymorpha subsp. ruderalis TaxID=1480154 RepID=A0A176W4W2_MARPO|nr:hypothetical protein AXG93_473s1070 [Marchantia polymorpha subsp. ruderalis]